MLKKHPQYAFKIKTILKKYMKLSPCETITDIEACIKAHQEVIDGGNEKWRLVYKERLEKIKALKQCISK